MQKSIDIRVVMITLDTVSKLKTRQSSSKAQQHFCFLDHKTIISFDHAKLFTNKSETEERSRFCVLEEVEKINSIENSI
jgi:hypothetical protein